MRPITIQLAEFMQAPPEAVSAEILNTERWPEFEGYWLLPGIEKAEFIVQTPQVVGSKIQVTNKDGSRHVEEIVKWDANHEVILRFQEFQAPLKNLATHFVETWQSERLGARTRATRSMTLHPTGLFGWLMLLPISFLMKKSFEKNAAKFRRN